jgi:hypothetical protein
MLTRKTARTDAEIIAGLHEEIRRLKAEMTETEMERDAYRNQLDGNIPAATYWLQTKVVRQRWALRRLQHRNATLRFALQLMSRLREPVSAEEWAKARAEIVSEQQRDQIDKQLPDAAL